MKTFDPVDRELQVMVVLHTPAGRVALDWLTGETPTWERDHQRNRTRAAHRKTPRRREHGVVA